jgi:prepilin-type N-terminal cleavage/methylation domain-containing protein
MQVRSYKGKNRHSTGSHKIVIPCNFAQSGMSLVEVIMALTITAIAITVSSIIIASAGKNIRTTEGVYDTQNSIDQNISNIESFADRYTCSASNCNVSSSIPAKTSYIDTTNSTAWNNFKAKCNETDTDPSDGQPDLLTELKAYIEANLTAPTAINRVITVHGSDSAQNLSYVRHMTIQYREGDASGKILRDVTIMPTIVSYCP